MKTNEHKNTVNMLRSENLTKPIDVNINIFHYRNQDSREIRPRLSANSGMYRYKRRRCQSITGMVTIARIPFGKIVNDNSRWSHVKFTELWRRAPSCYKTAKPYKPALVKCSPHHIASNKIIRLLLSSAYGEHIGFSFLPSILQQLRLASETWAYNNYYWLVILINSHVEIPCRKRACQ